MGLKSVYSLKCLGLVPCPKASTTKVSHECQQALVCGALLPHGAHVLMCSCVVVFVASYNFMNISGFPPQLTNVYSIQDRSQSGQAEVQIGVVFRFVGCELIMVCVCMCESSTLRLFNQVTTVTEALYVPNGIAYYEGDLYVSLIDTIYRYNDVDHPNATFPIPTMDADILVASQTLLPNSTWHGWRYAIARDDELYVAVGAPCNVPGDADPACVSQDPVKRITSALNLSLSSLHTTTPHLLLVPSTV